MNYLDIKEENTPLNYNQFMSIMIDNLASYRKLQGNDKIQFESDTNSAMCLICPYVANTKPNKVKA